MATDNVLVLAASEALSIGVDADYVRLVQEDAHGENDHYIAIPRLAFAPVLAAIFRHLNEVEMESIHGYAQARLSDFDAEAQSHG